MAYPLALFNRNGIGDLVVSYSGEIANAVFLNTFFYSLQYYNYFKVVDGEIVESEDIDNNRYFRSTSVNSRGNPNFIFYGYKKFIAIEGGDIVGTIEKETTFNYYLNGINFGYTKNIVKDLKVVGICDNAGGIDSNGDILFIPVFSYQLQYIYSYTGFNNSNNGVSQDFILYNRVTMPLANKPFGGLYTVGKCYADPKNKKTIIPISDPYVRLSKDNNFSNINSTGSGNIVFPMNAFSREDESRIYYDSFFNDDFYLNYGYIYGTPTAYIDGTVTFPIETLRNIVTWKYQGD